MLWYTEVEGMDPHEVAPIMGITANSVAALSYRAREGLRKAWLQAHISDATASGECQWTMGHLGDHTRNGLSARDAERMTDHLEDCAKCTIVSEEVDEVGSHLAMVMLPAAARRDRRRHPALAARRAVVRDGRRAHPGHAADRRGGRHGGAAVAAPVIAGALSMGAASSTGALVGGLAVAAVLGTTIALGVVPPASSEPPVVAAEIQDVASPTATHGAGRRLPQTAAPDRQTPTTCLASWAGSATRSADCWAAMTTASAASSTGVTDVVDDTVQDVVQTVTQPVTVNVSISGTGTPGASVALKAAGTVYATTTVGANGTYSISAGGIPQAVGNISVVQTVDQSLLGGLLGGVLNVLKPLTISSSSGGLPVHRRRLTRRQQRHVLAADRLCGDPSGDARVPRRSGHASDVIDDGRRSLFW